MELPKDWVRLREAYEHEQGWRNKGELAIRQEMERRLAAYFERKRAAKAESPRRTAAQEAADLNRIARALPKLPRLVDMGTSGHMSGQNKLNRDRAAVGLPRLRELNQLRREAADKVEDIRVWRNHR